MLIICRRHISERKLDLERQHQELSQEITGIRNQYMQMKKTIDQLNVSLTLSTARSVSHVLICRAEKNN